MPPKLSSVPSIFFQCVGQEVISRAVSVFPLVYIDVSAQTGELVSVQTRWRGCHCAMARESITRAGGTETPTPFARIFFKRGRHKRAALRAFALHRGRCPALERLEMEWNFDMHARYKVQVHTGQSLAYVVLKPLGTLKRLVRIKDPQYLPVSPKPCRRTPLSPFLPSGNSASPPGCSCKLLSFTPHHTDATDATDAPIQADRILSATTSSAPPLAGRPCRPSTRRMARHSWKSLMLPRKMSTRRSGRRERRSRLRGETTCKRLNEERVSRRNRPASEAG